MPLGRFGGSGGLHRQVKVTVPGSAIEVEVDELLAPLLLELWERGVQTTGSCQNAALVPPGRRSRETDAQFLGRLAAWDDDDESGEAHIRFGSVEWAQTFAEFVGAEATIHRDFEGVDTAEMVGPGAARAVAKIRSDAPPDWPSRSLCVSFPAESIDELTQDLAAQREREAVTVRLP